MAGGAAATFSYCINPTFLNTWLRQPLLYQLLRQMSASPPLSSCS